MLQVPPDGLCCYPLLQGFSHTHTNTTWGCSWGCFLRVLYISGILSLSPGRRDWTPRNYGSIHLVHRNWTSMRQENLREIWRVLIDTEQDEQYKNVWAILVWFLYVFATCETKNQYNLWYFLNVSNQFWESEYCLQDRMRTKRSSGYACRPLVQRMIGNWMCAAWPETDWIEGSPICNLCFTCTISSQRWYVSSHLVPLLRCWNYRSALRASKNVGNPDELASQIIGSLGTINQDISRLK